MNARYRFYTVVVALTTALATLAAGETFKIDNAHSTIGFKVHQFLGVTSGKFARFSGTIEVDRDHPERSSVSARISVASIDTGIQKRDDHLRSAEFFNVAKFPEITFKSRGVKQTGQQSGDIAGDLSMHGVTKPVTLHVKLVSPISAQTKQTHWAVTIDPIKRRDFGLMFSGTAEAISGISQDVSINIDVEAVAAR